MHRAINKIEGAGDASIDNEVSDKHGGDEAKQKEVEGAGEAYEESEVLKDLIKSFPGSSLHIIR